MTNIYVGNLDFPLPKQLQITRGVRAVKTVTVVMDATQVNRGDLRSSR
jgi:hypothetical protein